ncbi:sigma-70 family RNA polymerase sigma factor [Rathayibacter sp. VKM Ac-2803]|uniref:RNA polymerase sigma factor n=1 Tax=Rathayibacter sp. VKM Ac-2803 TaxID=2609256 RepID=UPI0013580156|nr:sigma-70 family RNA polymerase sigma factor [Rathayibacter sp. VKM Ac-2803]MWV48859.1 sigma-70 family RNA polymerase sigma factor [Rathayibacter sp. VKM Ac-2803]
MIDHARLAELHRAHYGDLIRYFARRGALDDADELAAEVFVIAWRKVPAELEDPRPWLFGVARKVLGNARRSHQRKHSLDVPLDGDADGSSGGRIPRVDSATGEIALRLDLQRAWNELAPADQEILALTAWEDLTVTQAAEALGMRRSTAAMRLSRARGRLRTLLSAPAPPSPPPAGPRPHEQESS